METETKSLRVEFKTDTSELKPGEFSALYSVFGNVDSGGDRIVKGAFAGTLDAWRAKGDPIPVIWSHQWTNPEAHIGYTLPDDMEETDEGLLIRRGVLDIDKAFAAQVQHLMKSRRVTQGSFGYRVLKAQDVEEDGQPYGVRELLELELLEIGPTLLGMNEATRLIEAASATPPGLTAMLTPDYLKSLPEAEATALRESLKSFLENDPPPAGDTPNTLDPAVIAVMTRTRHEGA